MSAIAQGSVQQSIDPSGADQLEGHENPVSVLSQIEELGEDDPATLASAGAGNEILSNAPTL